MKHFYRLSCFFLLILFIGSGLPAQATHVLGGEIRAEVVSCQSFTYKITVVVYTEAGSDVTFGMGLLSLGFGEVIELGHADDAFSSSVQATDSSVVINKLVIERAFPGHGIYLINYREFNRNANIINIRNAVNTPFYAETKLTVDPVLCNSSPVLSDTLSPRVYAGSRYELRINARDADGDSLSAELVTPREDHDSEVLGYKLPINYDLELLDNPVASDGLSLPTFTLTPEALVWDAPNLGGEFVVAIRINEWRKVDGEWLSPGYVTRDMVIHVIDTVNQTNAGDLLITDVEEAFNEPDVYVYPNPTFGPFSLEIQDDSWAGGTATMYNIIGEALDERAIAIGSNAYNISDFTSGFYFLNLRKDELRKTLRLVKR